MPKATTKTEEETRPVGRPPLYETVEELQDKIDEYFDYCDNKTKDMYSEKQGNMIVADPEPYTMAGLAYALGMSRQTLIDYKNRDEFIDAIKKARDRVEADVERRMNSKDTFTPGLIFNAKNNFGWRDKIAQEISNPDGSLNPYNALTAEELRKLAGK